MLLALCGAVSVHATSEAAPSEERHPVAKYAPYMQAVFGASYKTANRMAVVDLPDPKEAGAMLHLAMLGVDATRLPSGDTVLVVQGEHAESDGTPQSSHAEAGLLSLYLLRQEKGNWTVLRRHENVAALGSFGQVGSTRWVRTPAGRQLLAVVHGGMWGGYENEILSLFDPSAPEVHDLAGGGIKIHSGNDGACETDARPATCWNANARWRFERAPGKAEYDDLVLTFSGATGEAAVPPATRRMRKISGSARYAFEQGKYVLRTGTNPVPDI